MDVNEAIRTRRAVRKFTAQPVADAEVNLILDAGRRAQSSKNSQPWHFVVVRERPTLEALSRTGTYAGHIAGAAFAVVLVDTRGGEWGAFDLGQAAAQMQLAAHAIGIGSCLANIYQPDEARQLLAIPAAHRVFAALSFGYPAPDHRPLKLGGRKPLPDITHWDTW